MAYRAHQSTFAAAIGRTLAAVAVVFAAITLMPSTADALQIAQECRIFTDKLGCTCAVQNGGGIADQRGGGKRWFSVRSKRSPTNEAFVKCQLAGKGRG